MGNENKGRDKAREFLKAKGKDPDKFLPKDGNPDPESQSAGSKPESSAGNQKTVVTTPETEEQKKAKADEALRLAQEEAEEEKRILEGDEASLSEEDKKKKKELLVLKAEEKEAKREANIQKRIDELVGEIKALKAEKNQDKEQIKALESDLQNLRGSVEKDPGKLKLELRKLETDRISKYIEEDLDKPREERREMSKEELEEWMVEDLVAAQEWLADRQLRRSQERQTDHQNLTTGADARTKAEAVVKKQRESQARVLAKHPDLDISARQAELKAQGKSQKEIQEIVFKENPKIKIITDILRENADTYIMSENGPELLAAEMEKRLKTNSSADHEARIAEEAAEAERQRQKNIDEGLEPNGAGAGGGKNAISSEFEKENPELYKKQLAIWKKQFPKLSDKELRSRLDNRLKARRSMGAA